MDNYPHSIRITNLDIIQVFNVLKPLNPIQEALCKWFNIPRAKDCIVSIMVEVDFNKTPPVEGDVYEDIFKRPWHIQSVNNLYSSTSHQISGRRFVQMTCMEKNPEGRMNPVLMRYKYQTFKEIEDEKVTDTNSNDKPSSRTRIV